MKTGEELISRYKELYDKMVLSKDPKNMKVFGESEMWAFGEIAKMYPEMADMWLSMLEAVCWKNYISEKEALKISNKIRNEDNSVGFHWSYDTFENVVEKLGGKTSEEPYYNTYALYVTANMIYSDLANSIAEDMGYAKASDVATEKMALSCYKKAVAYLKDKDDNFHIREYFAAHLR